MKLTVNSREFCRALSTAFRAVPTKTATPILETFLIRCDRGRVLVTGSDANITIISSCEGEGEGEACINAKQICDLFKLLPDVTATVETGDKSAKITWGKGHSEMPCYSVDDYPDVGDSPDLKTRVDADILRRGFKHTIPHTANDELRKTLMGVYFNSTPGGFDMVASDTHTMSVYPVTGVELEDSFILPSAAAEYVRGALTSGEVLIGSDGNAVYFAIGGDTFIRATKIVGKFPNYSQVIPRGNANMATCSISSLASSIRRVSVAANKISNTIKVTFTALGGVTLEAQDLGFGTTAREELDFVEYSGEDVTIGFKADLFLKTVTGLDGDEIIIRIMDGRHAVLVEAKDDPSQAIVMPITIQ